MRPFFEAAEISVYHGDCRDVLPELPAGSVDLVLTDPPYGKQFVGEGRAIRKVNIRADGARQGVRVVRQALFAALPLLKADAHVLVFCHWESWPDFYDAICPLIPIKNALAWHKDRGGAGDTEMEYARDYEVILLRQPARVLAARRLRHGDLVSVAELAMLAHLPTDAAVPGLARAAARTVAPAPWLRTLGKVLGDADAGPPRPIAITAADARHHLHVVGATGVGKSTLIVNMVLDDVAQRRGVVVVDPSGDLVNDLLDRLPAEVGERLVLLDPSEDQAPPILNMLDGPDPDLAVDHVVGIFSRIYGSYWGPRTDDILRACCLTLLRQPHGEVTLAHVPRLLGDAEFRRPYVKAVASDAGLEGFWSWYEQLSGWARAQAVGPVLNKLRAFFLRPFVNRVVAGGASSFDLDQLLDDGGVLLARVPKGLLGEETSRLLGSFVLSKVWQAATHRARVGEPARRDMCAYADEAHNFLNLPIRFDEALAEARKYRLSLCLAHQYLGQLPRELREAISANARNKLIFAVSPEDATVLERHVAPELSAHDLANLGAFQAVARLVANGAEQPACTLRTRSAPAVVPGRADDLRARARQRFGRTDQQRHHQGVRQQVGADEAAARQHPGSAADTGMAATPPPASGANRRHRQ